MKFSIFFAGFSCLSFGVICQRNDGGEQDFGLIFDTPGNITITGIFEGLPGKGCRLESIKALEEMASAIWVVEALNKYEFLSGITIGLSVFEICQNEREKQTDLLQASRWKSETNGTTYKTGVLTTLNLKEAEETMENNGGFVSRIVHVGDEKTLADLTVLLLSNLQWMAVDAIVADSEDILNYFHEKASAEGISVSDRFLVDERFTLERNFSWRFRLSNNSTEENESKVVVAITGSDRIIKMAEVNKMAKEKNLKLILAPRDSVFVPSKELPEKTIVILPSIGDRNILTQFVLGKYGHKDFFNHREPTRSPLFLGVAASILKLLQPIKKVRDGESCGNDSRSEISCKKLGDFISFPGENETVLPESKNVEISPGDVENVLTVLKMEPNSNGELFLYIASIQKRQQQQHGEPGFSSEEAAIFQIFDSKKKTFRSILLKINDDLFYESVQVVETEKETERNVRIDADISRGKKTKSMSESTTNFNGTRENDSGGLFSTTEEFPFGLRNESRRNGPDVKDCMGNESSTTENLFPKWRRSTWVTVNACLGSIGLLCTLCIILSISGKVCGTDGLEGSPAYDLSLALSVVIAFLSSFPYHLEPSRDDRFTLRFICLCRRHAPPLAYAILFSLMLSRCMILMASGDDGNGFAGRVNGRFQAILFLCLSAVQISMTSRDWIRDRVTFRDSDCPEVNQSHEMFLSLAYEFILLAFLLAVIPFVFRLRRNRGEGLQLGLAAFFVAIDWSVWATFYYFLPPEHLDAAVAIGLNSSAAVILIFAFVPRAYLMASAIVRNRGGTTHLRTFDRNVLPEISGLDYKSNRNDSDSLQENDVCEAFNIGVSNPNFVQ